MNFGGLPGTVQLWLADPLPSDVLHSFTRRAAHPGVLRVAVRTVLPGSVVAPDSQIIRAFHNLVLRLNTHVYCNLL